MALFPTPVIKGRLRHGIADSGASLSHEDRRGQIPLGDGRTFSFSRGLKPLLEVWSLSWTGLIEDLRPSYGFLKQQAEANSEYFQWTSPSEPEGTEPKNWWCPDFKLVNIRGRAWRLTAQFVESP